MPATEKREFSSKTGAGATGALHRPPAAAREIERAATNDIFADGLGDFLAHGLAHLRVGLRRHGECALVGRRFHAVLEDAYVAHARHRLHEASVRTFVLELNVARLRGELSGATAEERFASYLALLRQREVRHALFREYETLARLLTETAVNVADALSEFAGRLSADMDIVRALIDPWTNALAPLESLTMAGDPHRRARCVIIATFGARRVVYKPRSLAAESAYSTLIDWLNARGQRPALRAPKVADRGEYGWMEYVSPAACSGASAVRRFYHRHGAHVALLYALEATDLHLENVIAHGEWPVLVDLEALCQPRLRRGPPPRDANAIIAASVLRIGLLPRGGSGACGGGVDLSGLGGAADQRSELSALRLVDAGTDMMRAIETYPIYPVAENLPVLEGRPVEAWRFAADVSSGFAATYRRLVAGRDELLAPDGPIAKLAGVRVRVIARATMFYGTLLTQSRHPNALRADVDRDRVLGRLSQGIDANPYLVPLMESELADLQRGDTPIFTVGTDDTALVDSGGHTIPDMLDVRPLDAVYQRIQTLGARDLARQVAIVRGAMATAAPAALAGGPTRNVLLRDTARPRNYAPFRWSRLVARRLLASAIDPGGSPEWIAATVGDGGRWRLAPVTDALYDGRAGIALFLAYHAAVAGDSAAESLARRLAARLATLADAWSRAGSDAPVDLGAFSGAAGVVYVLAHLGHLWCDPLLYDAAEPLALRIGANIARDERHDVIGGAAGSLKCILSLHACRGTTALLSAATACGDALLAHARPMPMGLGWVGSHGPTPLLGYSHGASGIAASLLQLAGAVRNPRDGARYREAASGALEYERALYVASARNWPDLREEAKGSASFAAWCHGAPGIALARLEALAHLDDPRLAVERDVALSTTVRSGCARSHSLCHGVAGNLEIVWTAALAGDPRWAREAETLADRLATSLARHGVVCGTPNGVETPGLMTGITGVAYGQLRLAAPSVVPSVLALEPPRVSGAHSMSTQSRTTSDVRCREPVSSSRS